MKAESTPDRITQSCEYNEDVGSSVVSFRRRDAKLTRTASLDRLSINNENVKGEKPKNGSNGDKSLAENNIVEGFLCPICKCDLGRPDYLQVHFERSHMSTMYDQSLLNNSFDFRSIISRAKNKVLRSLDDSIPGGSFDLSTDSSNPISRSADYTTNKADERREAPSRPVTEEKHDECNKRVRPLVLVSRSRTKMFISFRDLRSSYRSSRSEQIISRLNRLVTIDVNGANKRRVLEKHITPWADDRDVRRCPNCTESFGLLKRKHHCRLCGFVMCTQCSLFFSTSFAQDFLQDIRDKEESEFPLEEVDATTTEKPVGSGSKFADGEIWNGIKRSDSISSTTSSITGADGSKSIRLCQDCRQVLREKYECLQDKHMASVSVLPVFYRQLACAVRTLLAIRSNSHQPRDVRSSVAGDQYANADAYSDFQLMIERQVSVELDKIHSTLKEIDSYLKGELPSADDSQTLTTVKRKIAEALKSYGILSIQDSLTWRGQFKSAQSVRQRQTPKRPAGQAPKPRPKDQIHLDEKVPDDVSPILEQITQVRKFIENAKAGQRYDEVKALETNLRDLQLMLKGMRIK